MQPATLISYGTRGGKQHHLQTESALCSLRSKFRRCIFGGKTVPSLSRARISLQRFVNRLFVNLNQLSSQMLARAWELAWEFWCCRICCSRDAPRIYIRNTLCTHLDYLLLSPCRSN